MNVQLDWPYRQTCMEFCHAYAAWYCQVCNKHNSLLLHFLPFRSVGQLIGDEGSYLLNGKTNLLIALHALSKNKIIQKRLKIVIRCLSLKFWPEGPLGCPPWPSWPPAVEAGAAVRGAFSRTWMAGVEIIPPPCLTSAVQGSTRIWARISWACEGVRSRGVGSLTCLTRAWRGSRERRWRRPRISRRIGLSENGSAAVGSRTETFVKCMLTYG